jgi:hypothetical protein
MKKKSFKYNFLVSLFSLVIFLLPFFVLAEPEAKSKLIPCTENCGFTHFITLINNVIDFVFLKLAVPIAAIAFAYAGFLLIVSGGDTSKRSKAKKIFTNVAIGLIFVAAAWLIVNTILSILGYTGSWNIF